MTLALKREQVHFYASLRKLPQVGDYLRVHEGFGNIVITDVKSRSSHRTISGPRLPGRFSFSESMLRRQRRSGNPAKGEMLPGVRERRFAAFRRTPRYCPAVKKEPANTVCRLP